MKKNCIWCLQFIVIATLFTSCVYSKDSYIDGFESFVEILEEKNSISQEELPVIEEYYTDLTKTYYDKYKDKLSKSDMKRLVELEVRYHASLAKTDLSNLKDKLKNIETKLNKILN